MANISNFGDKGLCYSDVKTSKHYILFLTTFRGGLSARYDDLFGAAVPWDRENEMSVYQAIGWLLILLEFYANDSKLTAKIDGAHQ